jgi:hypothetical protein
MIVDLPGNCWKAIHSSPPAMTIGVGEGVAAAVGVAADADGARD